MMCITAYVPDEKSVLLHSMCVLCISPQEMFYEASGQFDEAEALLQEQLQATPQAPMLLKRQVALEKSRDNLSAAIEALRKYVDMYQTDREAWEELGELYLQVRLLMGFLRNPADAHAEHCTCRDAASGRWSAI